ncbi:RICIN domain-containing protein [Streptomyces sp. WM6378]|uniref:RICIN domain-containing protein n=1 Tax=Streptomyces sp. WM6378 TaxID=1415557 RepID=UPI0006AFD7CD|nr:RICIN domain-containing protein [Streptomyces sp. WM6378]KOU35091.1 hypothetical protein ADK54_38520 [Streptomyces sp. WM6378]
MRRTAAALLTALLAICAAVALPGTAQAAASPGSCTTHYGGPMGSASCSGVAPGTQWRAVVGCFYVVSGQPVPFQVVGNIVTGDGTSTGACTGASYATKYIDAVVVGVTGSQGRLVGYGGKCVDIRSGKTTVATPVQVYDCNGTGAQWWTLGTDHTVRALGMCLNVVWGRSENGTKVEIYDCQQGSQSEQWVPQPDGSLKNALTGKCLDDLGFNTANGTQLGIWDCNGLANQKWVLTP